MCSEFFSKSRVAVLAGVIMIAPGMGTLSHAADITYGQGNDYGQEPQPGYPATSPTYVWNGPYIGAYGGYNLLDGQISGLSDVDDIDGLTAGGYLGFSTQIDENWVAGIEGTLGIASADGNAGGVSVDQDWEASLRARMGYAFGSSMIYGLGGVAGTDVNASSATATDSNVLLGWQIGAGLETFLTEQVVGRIEYDYSDYAKREFSLGASGTRDIGLSGHTIKVGVGFKF